VTQAAGRHTSLTFTTGVRPGGKWWLRVLFWAGRRIPAVAQPLVPLRVIHHARWTLLERLDGRVLDPPVLLFESDFDVDLEQYIDTFAEVLTWRMRSVWSTSYANPGLIPTDQFHAWVMQHEAAPGHFYSAFPECTVDRIVESLDLAADLDAFVASSRGIDDADAFAAAYRRFLAEVQACL
jgi:hypothetical protein